MLAPAGLRAEVPLRDCASDAGPATGRCGTLAVWEDRRAASGRQIPLKIVVLPALSRTPAPDPLFVLAGGPGQAATEIIDQVRGPLRRVRHQRDIVFVDQRGTGSSNALDCDIPGDETGRDGHLPAFVRAMETCATAFQADLRLYTTPHAADDLDQVRRALGYDTINLWGGSYGTRMALVYMRRYPQSVRSAVLDGAAPLVLAIPGHFPRDGQRALDRLFAACRTDPACRARFPDLAPRFTALLERLETRPRRQRLQHPLSGAWDEVKISRALVGGIVHSALYSSALSALLPLAIDRADRGDFQPLTGLAAAGAQWGEGVSRGMSFAVLCAEDVPRATVAEGPDYLLGRGLVELYRTICQSFPPPDLATDYFEPVVSPVPTLVLSGADDPVAPPRWGREAARHLPNARHLVVPGTGHITLWSGCVPRLVAQFVEDADAKALDPTCLAQVRRPSFFTSYTGP